MSLEWTRSISSKNELRQIESTSFKITYVAIIVNESNPMVQRIEVWKANIGLCGLWSLIWGIWKWGEYINLMIVEQMDTKLFVFVLFIFNLYLEGCEVGHWSEWGTCSRNNRTCGFKWGLETRTRQIVKKPAKDTIPCPTIAESRRCKMAMRHCPGGECGESLPWVVCFLNLLLPYPHPQ